MRVLVDSNGGVACGRSSRRFPCDSSGFTIADTSNSASITVNIEQSLKFSLKVRVLPAISLLTKFYVLSIRSAGILNGRYHDFCVSGTNIGGISRLSALLQLACEYRNRDSYQHGLLPPNAPLTVSCLLCCTSPVPRKSAVPILRPDFCPIIHFSLSDGARA